VRRFAEIDSTNRYLLDEARSGAPEGVVVVADHQTAGRGRLGRTWTAPAGSSLLMSVLLRPTLPPARMHLVTAAMALAAGDACEALSGVRPALKWPNDLIIRDLIIRDLIIRDLISGDLISGEAKLAGVLAEAELPAVVVGLGLNLTRPPSGSQDDTETMSFRLPEAGVGGAGRGEAGVALSDAAGRSIDASALLNRLLVGLGALVADWDTVSQRYRRACATVGRRVRVTLAGGDDAFTGTAVEVTGNGYLCVDTGGGVRVISAADVVHLR
jgi:BirA family biotin operon repressor/biotin-[acetyl-CoA-carboxylase] ligase